MVRVDVVTVRCYERASAKKHLIDFKIPALPALRTDETGVGYVEVAGYTRGVHGFVSSPDISDEE